MPGGTERFWCASIVALVTLADAAASQEQARITRRDTYWLGAGLGVGQEGLGGQLNISYQFSANLISFRVASTAGLFEDEFTDYGLLYGRATRGAEDRYLVAAALGVAVVDGCRGGGVFSSCRGMSAVIGLPVEMQVFWRPGKVVGLGLYGFANFNQSQTFAGLTVSLQVGRLR
jgi:hypothetical protein